MRISHRPERRIAHRSEIELEPGVRAQLPHIVEAEAHDEIVRMLSVHDGLAESRFAGLEQQRIAAIGDGGRLQAQHQIHLERALSHRRDAPPRP